MWTTKTGKDVTQRAFALKLTDGAWVVIRRLAPTDADAVVALHDALSQRERYLRFFTMQPVRLKALARTLTEGREGDFALGAFESGTLVGVANYARCAVSQRLRRSPSSSLTPINYEEWVPLYFDGLLRSPAPREFSTSWQTFWPLIICYSKYFAMQGCARAEYTPSTASSISPSICARRYPN